MCKESDKFVFRHYSIPQIEFYVDFLKTIIYSVTVPGKDLKQIVVTSACISEEATILICPHQDAADPLLNQLQYSRTLIG